MTLAEIRKTQEADKKYEVGLAHQLDNGDVIVLIEGHTYPYNGYKVIRYYVDNGVWNFEQIGEDNEYCSWALDDFQKSLNAKHIHNDYIVKDILLENKE